jgi:hypothetical protein
MIRVLVLFVGLVLGLGLAVMTQGKVGHLRFIAKGNLPAWVQMLSPDSSLLQGAAMQVVPNIDAEWQFKGVAIDGLLYGLRLTGDGVTVRGDVKVAWDRQTIQFWQARGEVDLVKAYTPAAVTTLTGKLYVEGLMGSVDYMNKHIRSLSGDVILRETQFDGNNLDDLNIHFSPGEADTWLAQLNMPQGALVLSADVRGQFNNSVAQIDGVVSEGSDMPDRWRRALDQSLPKTADGWQLDQSLDLSNPVIGR